MCSQPAAEGFVLLGDKIKEIETRLFYFKHGPNCRTVRKKELLKDDLLTVAENMEFDPLGEKQNDTSKCKA